MMDNATRGTIPWLMAAGRAVLGPVLIAGASCRWNGMALAGMVVTALVSDIFDGVLARRWRCDTGALRLFDSMADTAFYVCTGVALWLAHPADLIEDKVPLFALLGIEAVKFAFDFAKFGKPSSYHSYLAKCWGLLLASALIAEFAAGHARALLVPALWLGVVVNLEGLVVSTLLPVWRQDVPTIAAALRLRRVVVE
jgi:CDP-diacylglycerol--glycerol-3-phosphate 3-phosphatidyltransferase